MRFSLRKKEKKKKNLTILIWMKMIILPRVKKTFDSILVALFLLGSSILYLNIVSFLEPNFYFITSGHKKYVNQWL